MSKVIKYSKIVLVSILFLSFINGLVTANDNQPSYGGTLNVGVPDSPPTLDWITRNLVK